MHPVQVMGQHIYHIPRTLRQTKLEKFIFSPIYRTQEWMINFLDPQQM